MTGSASINAIDLLEDWHAALCVFRTEALESLGSIAQEIQRADTWLDDQLRHWQREARDAELDVVRFKAELSNRRFPGFDGRIPDCSVQEDNLRRAEQELEYARDQIDVVRRWFVKMPKLVDEAWSSSSRHLTNFLEADLPRGLSALKSQIASLDAYVNLKPEALPTPPPPRKDSP